MSKIIDITDKLNFEEKPIIKIKEVEATVNNDAASMLKVIAIFDEKENKSSDDFSKLYELLFDESEREKIDSLKLSINDFMTLIMETAESVISDGKPDEGETVTPATI